SRSLLSHFLCYPGPLVTKDPFPFAMGTFAGLHHHSQRTAALARAEERRGANQPSPTRIQVRKKEPREEKKKGSEGLEKERTSERLKTKTLSPNLKPGRSDVLWPSRPSEKTSI